MATGRSCHDTGVILGDAKFAVCAGGNGFTVLSMTSDDCGSIENPVVLYSKTIDGVSVGHSAAFASEIAYADPAPLVSPDNPAAIEPGGDWSTYWYNGRIYESDITRGMTIWNLSDDAVAGARRLGHLNPQTQEFTLG